MSVDSGFVYFNSDLRKQLGIQEIRLGRPRTISAPSTFRCVGSKRICLPHSFPVSSRFSDKNCHLQCFEAPIDRSNACNFRSSEGAAQSECIHSSQGIYAPIVDYEIVEKQQTFTIYRINVVTPVKNWFVFRRYSDFERLNKRLTKHFPGFKQDLPKKGWFSDNFDYKFIENRRKDLQAYVDTLLKHDMLSRSEDVDDFLCISDPPGPFDSIEESRAFCQQLEQTCNKLKQDMKEIDADLNLTKSQLAQARVQQEVVISALKAERAKCKKYEHLYRDLEKKITFPILTEVDWSPTSI